MVAKLSDYLVESNSFINHIAQRTNIDPREYNCDNTLQDKGEYMKLLESITSEKKRQQFDMFYKRYIEDDMEEVSKDLAFIFALQYYFL